MLELISEFARDFTRLDTQTWTILLVMVGWSVLFLQIAVDSKSYTALFVPGMVIGAMAAIYIAREARFTMSPSTDINIILLSVIGIIAGFIATVLVILGLHWIADLRRPLTDETRA